MDLGYIMCVDDDTDDCDLFSDAMAPFNNVIQVRSFQTGVAAITFLKKAVESKNLPRLIVLDVNMPQMTGYEVLVEMKKIIADQRPVPIFYNRVKKQRSPFSREPGNHYDHEALNHE